MDIQINAVEARVLGALLEKSITTPDYYPMSLGGIAGACNQKSNREPVMNLSEAETMDTLDTLMSKRLVWEKTPSGSRVTKYAHRLSNTLGITFEFSDKDLGVLCVLMLRGPQTAGELRTRTARLCKFENTEEVERTLTSLAQREDGPYVTRLPRQPGHKESRYAHLLCGDVEFDEEQTPRIHNSAASAPADDGRLSSLEQEVAELREELSTLKARMDAHFASYRTDDP